MNKNNTLSVITACYNEENIIKKNIINWAKYFNKIKEIKKFEIIITDDGSTDNTYKILKELKTQIKELKIFKLKKNQGASFAFRNSLSKASYKFVLINDSDNQFPISNFKILWKEINKSKRDAVFGARNRLKEINFLSIGSFISGKILNLVYAAKVKDFNCALKLIKLELARKIKLETVGLNYSTEMTAKILELTSNISSIPIFHKKNEKNKIFKKLITDSFYRVVFVIYLIFRRFLLKLNIIKT